MTIDKFAEGLFWVRYYGTYANCIYYLVLSSQQPHEWIDY